MRVYEFILTEAIKRGEKIPLSWLHSQKIRQRKIQAEKKRKAPLIAAMYARESEHERELQQIELSKERLELKRLQAEYEKLQMEQGEENYEAIKRLSRSAMKRRNQSQF